MHSIKLIKMLVALKPEEFKYLRWFVQSNFFNTDANLLGLYDALRKHYPAFDSRSLTKERVFEKVFPGQPFNDGKWRNLFSKMTKAVEDYLVMLELERETLTKEKLLTKAYGRRNLYEFFEKSTGRLADVLEKDALKNADALRERLLLNLAYCQHPQTNKLICFDRLRSVTDDLDSYYFAEKLRLACELKVFENVTSGVSSVRLRDVISGALRAGFGGQFAYLELYDRILTLLEEGATAEEFQEHVAEFSKILEELSSNDRQFGLLHLLNFAINQSNKGQTEFRPLVLELYKLGMEKEILLQDGKISGNTFLNIASYGSGLKEFVWTRQFIEKYKPRLDGGNKKEAEKLGLGYLFFHEKKYSGVIELLLNYSPSESLPNYLAARNLVHRSHFELFLSDDTYYELFLSSGEAFKKYLKREIRLPAGKRRWHLNFIVILEKLGKMKMAGTLDSRAKEALLKEIREKPMLLKAWLREKLGEL